MICFLLLVVFLPAIASVNNDGTVTTDVVKSRLATPDSDDQASKDFWTAEKFLSAQVLNISAPKTASLSRAVTNVPNGPPTQFNGVQNQANQTKGRALSSTGRHIYTTGRVFWTVGATTYSCSGVVVPSSTGDLILTSGNCVFNTAALSWYINNNWVFVPGYYNGYAPYGIWSPRRMWLRTEFASTTPNYNYDVGFVALNRLSGWSIQGYVGSQGLGFNWPRLQLTYSFGYPTNLFSGLWLTYCAGYAQSPSGSLGGYYGQGLGCTMGAGSAGGPRLQNFVESTGAGYVTSVNSFSRSDIPNILHGAYFDSNLLSTYNLAQVG